MTAALNIDSVNNPEPPLEAAAGPAAGSDAPVIDDRRKAPAGSVPVTAERRVADRDRRIAPRARIFKGAQIVQPVGLPVPCMVRNISETGARLEVQYPVIGHTFDIVFDDPKWPRRSCRVVWRRPNGIGVTFV